MTLLPTSGYPAEFSKIDVPILVPDESENRFVGVEVPDRKKVSSPAFRFALVVLCWNCTGKGDKGINVAIIHPLKNPQCGL